MKFRSLLISILAAMALLAACAPATPTVPAVDVIGTRSMELAALMMTQTVAAYSPTRYLPLRQNRLLHLPSNRPQQKLRIPKLLTALPHVT